MAVPVSPPLNGRNVAEFAMSRPSVQRSTLRRYAKPPEEQKPPIVMYDPVRKVLAEYFRGDRDDAVLRRVQDLLDGPSSANAEFAARRRKSNRAAIAHLRNLNLDGTLSDVTIERADVQVERLRVKSTTDFYALFTPANRRMKPRRIAAIFNLSGVSKASADDRKQWMQIEAEVAFRAAAARDIMIDEVLYVDVSREELHVFRKPSERLWADLEAICERIQREWRQIRLESSAGGAAEA